MSLNRVAFKESILKSPILDFAQKKVEENDEIIMVVLMGSEVSGLALPDSDIDIAIFTHRSWDLEPSLIGEFENRHFHWWMTPLCKEIIAWNTPKFIPLVIAGNYYSDFSDENIIYINPKYQPLLNFLQNKVNLIPLQTWTAFMLYKYYFKYIKASLNLKRFRFVKSLLPLLDFYYSQNSLERNIDLLLRIKQSIKIASNDENILTASDWDEIFKIFNWVHNYFIEKGSLIKETLQWYLQYEQVLEECK